MKRPARVEGLAGIIEIWRPLFDSMPQGAAILAPDGTLLLERGLFPHRNGGSFLGSRLWDNVLAEHRDLVRGSVENAASGAEVEDEFEVPTPSGEPRWFHFTIRPVRWDGSVRALLILRRDITEQRQTEAERAESEGRYRAVF